MPSRFHRPSPPSPGKASHTFLSHQQCPTFKASVDYLMSCSLRPILMIQNC